MYKNVINDVVSENIFPVANHYKIIGPYVVFVNM